VGEINDFVIYRDNLYIGGEAGVYRIMGDNSWQPLGDPGVFTEVNDLYVFGDALYAADTLVVGRWQGIEWDLLERDNAEEFFEHDNSLYVYTESGMVIERVISEPDPTVCSIPAAAERNIIK